MPKRALQAWALVAFLLTGGLGGNLSARTVTVDQARGDDARDGTEAQGPLRTLARGLALCGPGDTLAIVPGEAPYHESLVVGGRGGLPGRPLIVEGNGAVLSGLQALPAEAWQDRGDGRWFLPTAVRYGSLLPFLVRPDGTRVPEAAKAEALSAGQALWDAQGILLRCPIGQHPAELGLRGTLLDAGVSLNGASYVTVRNLTCEYFANDGFNVHGSCQGLFFENVVARHNGDDGFSVHEDVGVAVYGGWFHGNTFGIQDVNLSRSIYCGVRVENNRAHGVHFTGGAHSLTDSLVRDNLQDQVRVDRDPAPHMGVDGDNPLTAGTVYLYNDAIVGGRTGILATAGTRVAVRACYVAGAKTGIQALGAAVLHVNGSVVTDCTDRELHCESAACRFDGNLYWPGRLGWGAALFTPAQFAEYQSASGQDGSSVLGAPMYAEAGRFRLRSPCIIRSDRWAVPGLAAEPQLPFGGAVDNPRAAATASAGAAAVLRFDFETANPWSRVYPEPAKGADGIPIAATAVLSTEQAVSGKHAVKLDVALPSGEPRTWLIKLFSVRLDPCVRPVRSLRFQLFGDGSGLTFCPRLRDADGVSFYGPAQKLDWQGWREVAWDLSTTLPRDLAGAASRQRQKVPPLEVVLDLHPQVGPQGARLVLYADDLEVTLDAE
jgi:hypothetical protein